jgi:dolichol kinase
MMLPAACSGSGLALWLLLGGLVPALVESVPMPRWLNDNLCIPVLSAAVLGACQSAGVPALE